MKAFLGIIAALIVVLVGVGVYAAVSGGSDLYDEATSIKYNQVKEDSEGVNYYYYYQDSCTHCIDLKPYMTAVYEYEQENDDFDLYIVDIELGENAGAWSSDANFQSLNEAGRIEYENSVDNYVVTGTPTLIQETDGVVTGYFVGSSTIAEHFNDTYGITK